MPGLVPVGGLWRSAAGKVIVGQASHALQSSVVKAYERDMNILPTLQ